MTKTPERFLPSLSLTVNAANAATAVVVAGVSAAERTAAAVVDGGGRFGRKELTEYWAWHQRCP